ncbi:restriction endonuclease subunit S [Bacteroides uniformis]|jgi:restriction endonuclease S subunit|uniref:restriction endonuclease subunit S n=2 Tax=Bacteroidales TaxID=171549 RepID=UPI001C3759C7|nr:restriction endonuclease subunit S [Bacteroides uniformis]MBV4282230.1 restriction endonuclease subunit S [Bacteroides uniformis]
MMIAHSKCVMVIVLTHSLTELSVHTPHYENVPFEVPDNWAWTTLGEICLFLSRGKSPKYSDSDKTYPVFAQKCNLKEGGISLEQARFLDPSTICKWSEEYKLKTGDVLVNSTGTGTVGRTRLFHESYLKHYPFVVPDSHVSVIRTASEIKSEFVFAYISSKLIQEYLEDNLAGSTNQKELYIGVLSDLSFPLPPLAEQQRIVTEIEKWFSLIDQIEQGKDDLHSIVKQTKSKILDLAIHGELVPQDPNDEPAIELLKRINPSFTPCDNGHYPQLPDGWCKCRLEDIVEYEQPQAYIVNSTDYDDRYLTPVLTAGKSFVIGYTNETEGIYQNTPCIIFDDFTTDSKLVDFPFKVKSSAMKILKVADDIEIEYVAMFMNITRLIGDTHKRYWISEYSKLCIPIPPKEEQKRIINAANAMFEKLDAIIESL